MRHATQDSSDPGSNRGNVLIAVALTAAVICAGVLVFIAVSGSGSPKSTAGGRSAAASPTIVLDSHAKIACEKLARATQKREGTGALDKAQAGIDEFAAQGEAAGSSISELADMAKRGDGDPVVLAGIRAWCAANWRAS